MSQLNTSGFQTSQVLKLDISQNELNKDLNELDLESPSKFDKEEPVSQIEVVQEEEAEYEQQPEDAADSKPVEHRHKRASSLMTVPDRLSPWQRTLSNGI